MGNKDTVRALFRRKAKEQWLTYIRKMQSDLAQFSLDYMEGSDSNQRQSLEMVLLTEMLNEVDKAIHILLEEI